MKEITKKCHGHCPVCGSDDLEWGNTELEGESLGYEFTCNACGAEGTEWYELTYIETVFEDATV